MALAMIYESGDLPERVRKHLLRTTSNWLYALCIDCGCPFTSCKWSFFAMPFSFALFWSDQTDIPLQDDPYELMISDRMTGFLFNE